MWQKGYGIFSVIVTQNLVTYNSSFAYNFNFFLEWLLAFSVLRIGRHDGIFLSTLFPAKRDEATSASN